MDAISTTNPFDTEFDELVIDDLANWHVPGLSIAVVSGDQVFAKVCNSHMFKLRTLVN